jgi:UDPglucose 6-dehydrogenase
MNITVIGTGYVGLVTGACFSEFGVQVTCVDQMQEKIELLERGEMPIYEPGLDEIVARNVRSGRLKFTTDDAEAIDRGLVIFIAVGTPSAEDGSTDLQYVEAVARGIGQRINSYKVVVTKSTVPVGTSDKVRGWIQEELDRRYLTSTIESILSIRNEFGTSYWDVKTNRGPREFVIQNVAENAQWLGDHRLLLVDVDGNRFEIPNLNDLDKKSMSQVEMVL